MTRCVWGVFLFLLLLQRSLLAACDFRLNRTSVVAGRAELCVLWRKAQEADQLNDLATCDNASHTPREPAIALATHGTINRLERMLFQSLMWKGPTFAAVLTTTQSEFEEVLRFHIRYPLIYLTVVILQNVPVPYPINFLRNIAVWSVSFSSAQEMLMLDADALPNGSWMEFRRNINLAKEILREEAGVMDQILFVVPAFDTKTNLSDLVAHDGSLCTKETLQEYLRLGMATVMHYPRPSYALDLTKWLTSSSGYRMEYRLMNEPYVIASVQTFRDMHPFDERFVGRGFNKQASHFELWASGYQYFTLNSVFVFNQENPVTVSILDRVAMGSSNELWKIVRAEIVQKYGLECRNSLWKICDDKGLHCDRVCTRMNAEPPAVHEKHRHVDVSSTSIVDKLKDSSWSSFERAANRAADYHSSNIHRHLKVSRSECLANIDVVYTWVNGSEEFHQRTRQMYIPPEAFTAEVNAGGNRRIKDHMLHFRFRDFGQNVSTLKFSILSLLKHANWVRNIHIVVADGQAFPSFLNSGNDRLKLVNHSTIMDATCLPTFNSCAIESKLHLIPNLSECFLYLNDDIMLVQDLKPETYWPVHESIPLAIFDGTEAPMRSNDEWHKKLANVARLLKTELNVRKVFLVGHHGHFFVKQVIQDIYALPRLRKELQRTECERWRSPYSVWLPMVYSNVYLASRHPRVMKESTLYYALTEFGGAGGVRTAFQILRNRPKEFQWLCLNDLMGRTAPSEMLTVLEDELNTLYHSNSSDIMDSDFFT